MKPELIGFGYFCNVYTTPDENIVKKIIKPSIKTENIKTHDAYWYFLELLIYSPIKGNMFFPKIYDYKVEKDSDGFDRRYVLTEKLESTINLSDRKINKITKNTLGFTFEYDDRIDYFTKLTRYVSDYRNIKNKEFLKASSFLLNEVFPVVRDKHGRVRLDISRQNMLYRPSTETLVFVDPITTGLRFSKEVDISKQTSKTPYSFKEKK